jgi:hypothetical protein
MALASDLVQPNAAPVAVQPINPQAAAAPEDAQALKEALPSAQAAPGEAGEAPALSDDLLKIPAMMGLLAGQPAALSAPLETFQKKPEAKIIQQNLPALESAGMGRYRSLAGDTAVLFNRFYVSPEEIQSADQAGQLTQIAPPFDQVNAAISGKGAKDHPALQEGRKVPGGFKMGTPNPPQSASPVSAPPPSAEKDMRAQQARMKNMQPGSPTSGPKPGAGRLLNQILKPVL